MSTWREQAALIIDEATGDLPADAPLAVRIAVVDAACPFAWRRMSWPQKAWQAARRDYLIRFGYRPRTKMQMARDAAALSELPLFETKGMTR